MYMYLCVCVCVCVPVQANENFAIHARFLLFSPSPVYEYRSSSAERWPNRVRIHELRFP